MSYEVNKIKYFLARNALIIQESKTTSSIYYFFKDYSVRYSDHYTNESKVNQIQVVRRSRKVFIKLPWSSEFGVYNEKTGYYLLRKILKTKTPEKVSNLNKYLRIKRRQKDSRKMKIYLKSLKGENLKTLIMNSGRNRFRA